MASWIFSDLRDPDKTMLTYWVVQPTFLAMSALRTPASLSRRVTMFEKENPAVFRYENARRFVFGLISLVVMFTKV